MAAMEDVWCDGGPYDGREISVEPHTYQAVIYAHRTVDDEWVAVELLYHRIGNIALYDGWRLAE
jgi:predicted HD phosphohydrolase